MAEALAAARERGTTAVAFGDLFLEDVRRYREERMSGTGLVPLFPLWGRPTRALAEEMIALGQRARAHLRRPARAAARVRRPRVRRARSCASCPPSVDPCGERGEFHSFAWDGPAFRRPVPVRVGEVVDRDGFVFADLLPGAGGSGGRSLPRTRKCGEALRVRRAAARPCSWPRPCWRAPRSHGAGPKPQRVASINLSADEVLVEILPPERLVSVTRWADAEGRRTSSGACRPRCTASSRRTWSSSWRCGPTSSWSRSTPTPTS